MHMKLWNNQSEQNTLADALTLQLPEHAVISVTGAGGKTSLIMALARELSEAGIKTAITTTTHMAHPCHISECGCDPYGSIECVLADNDGREDSGKLSGDNVSYIIDQIDRALDASGIVLAASPDQDNPMKITSPPDDVLEYLYDAADVTLVEADGSRRMPLKWPAPWEPAVPGRTDLTICVAGLSALGQSTSDVIYRADCLPDRLKRDTVDVNLLHAMLSSREGGRKGIHGDFRIFLNQVDDDTDRLAAAFRLQQILAVMGIRTAWGSLREAR